jgi:hypothetical protein
MTRETTSPWAALAQRAYGYREVAIATLMFGIYLHVSRLVFGDELFQQHLLRPIVDEIFAIPMTYAAIAGLAGWKSLRFHSRAHEIFSRVILGFIIISVPVHIATYFGASMSRISKFPMWYSLAEGALVYPAFAIALGRLRFVGDQEVPSHVG